jgi:hypothetical protein
MKKKLKQKPAHLYMQIAPGSKNELLLAAFHEKVRAVRSRWISPRTRKRG